MTTRYVIRVRDALWFKSVEADAEADEEWFDLTPDPEEAATFADPVDAARTVGRVSTVSPLTRERTLRRPMADVGARVQLLEEAREEAAAARA